MSSKVLLRYRVFISSKRYSLASELFLITTFKTLSFSSGSSNNETQEEAAVLGVLSNFF